MDASDWIAVFSMVISVAAVLISIVFGDKQNKYAKASQMRDLYNDFRDIYTGFLADNDISKTLAKNKDISEDEMKVSYAASFMINQAYLIFLYNDAGLYPKNVWENTQRDVKEMFKLPMIKKRWADVENLYSDEFKQFVNNK